MPFMGMTFAGSLAIARTLVQAPLKKGRRFLKKLTQLLVCSLVGLLLFGCVNRSQSVRVIPLPEISTPTADVKKLTSSRSGTVSEVAPPAIFKDLTDLLSRSTNAQQPQVTIAQPTSDQVVETTSVSLAIKLKGLTIYKDKKLGLGPHLQVILDNQPAQSVYDLEAPLKFSDLTPGSHTLRVFAVKPWGESFKGDTAYAQTTFHVFAKTGENTPQRDLPLLTYNEPQGSFGAEPILLDFHLNNAPLHRIAENDPDLSDWRIRCDLNGQSFIFDRWQPIYLKGFKPGQNWVQLTLIDEQGQPIDNAFNSTVRIINYEPAKRNTLAKMVRGELSLRQVGQIMVPGYEPPVEPIIEEPVIEEPVTDEPLIEKPVIETPAVEAPIIDEPAIETPAIKAPDIDEPIIDEPIIEAPSAEQQNKSSNSTASESPEEDSAAEIEQPDEKRPATSQPIDDDLKNFDSFAKDKQQKEKPLGQPSKEQPEEKPEEQPEESLLEPKTTVEDIQPQPNVELAPSESEFSAPKTGELETQNRQPQTDNPPADALDSPEPTNKTLRQPKESAVDSLKQQDDAATGPDIADKIQTFWQQLKQKGTDALTKLKSPAPQDKPETPAVPITGPDQLGPESAETSVIKDATTTEESTIAPSQDSDIETFNVEQPDTEQRLGKEASAEPADVEKGSTNPLEQETQQTTEQTLKDNPSEDKTPEDNLSENKTPEESIERALEEAIEQTIEKFDFEESPTELENN